MKQTIGTLVPILLFITLFALPRLAKAILKLSIGAPLVIYHSDLSTQYPMLSIQAEGRIGPIGINGIAAFGIFKGFSSAYYISQDGGFGIIGLRANYYFLKGKVIDLYAGGMVGYLLAENDIYVLPKDYGSNYSKYAYSPNYGYRLASQSMGFKAGLQVGTHVWLNKHVGVLAEIDYGTTLVNVGLVFKHH
jgi:hypothetical protein